VQIQKCVHYIASIDVTTLNLSKNFIHVHTIEFLPISNLPKKVLGPLAVGEYLQRYECECDLLRY